MVQAHLKQIAERNPELNAFVSVFAEEALEAAKAAESAMVRGESLGLLHGAPLTVKDSFDIAGQATLAGSKLRVGHRAAEDASAVARLRSEGAILLGRTNTPEMLANYETDNFLTGAHEQSVGPDADAGRIERREKRRRSRRSVRREELRAARGSIRVPAAFCGIAGLKPTPGRIPALGHFPALGYPAGLTSVVGPMARTTKDLRLLFAALASFEPRDPFEHARAAGGTGDSGRPHRRVAAVLSSAGGCASGGRGAEGGAAFARRRFSCGGIRADGDGTRA